MGTLGGKSTEIFKKRVLITKQYTQFFKGLEANNSKDWFDLHRKEYEEFVRQPFLELLEALIPKVKDLEPAISLNAKDAVFRINRDIRFSNDKTPYNTLMKAGFSPEGKKSELPGFYLGIGSEYVHVGGGLFNLKAQQLEKVRVLIKNNTTEFIDLLDSASFKTTFGTLQGDKSKRLKKDFLEVAERTSHIHRKQFYAMQKLDLAPLLGKEKLANVILDHFKEISHLNNFLNKAFK